MRLWRLVRRPYARTAFSGAGARNHGGRWNHPGTPMVYAAETLSLAALELLVHLDLDLAPPDLVAIPADLPDEAPVRRLESSDPRRDWRAYPAPASTQDLGTAWAASGATAALLVPSVVVPEERNVLLNPAHPDFRRLHIAPARPFRLDPRLRR
jgi:RES domain-containing protein